MNNNDLARLARLEKLFADNAITLVNEEAFTIILTSGATEKAFVFTPEHAKRFAQSLSYNVSLYEEKRGEIKASWQPGIQSPIPIASLSRKNKDDTNGDSNSERKNK